MKNKILYASFLAALIGFFVCATDAQTARRKKKTSARPAIQSTQTVASGDEDRGVFLDGNQIVLGENPRSPETIGETSSAPMVNQNTDGGENDGRIKELTERIKSLESAKKNDYDEKQKRLALNLDILTKAESRAESLRKQLFEMMEKESGVQTRLEQIRFDARPETIERATAFVGSLRPEEIREQRSKSLEAERKNLESLLVQIQTNRASLEENVSKADFLVEKIRFKLDKDIDDALVEKQDNQ